MKRRGTTILELAVAGALIGALLVVCLQLLAATAAGRRAADQQQCAILELDNVMERVVARPWAELTTAALAAVAGAREAFVLGGAEIYEVFLPLATRLYITHVDVKVAGDTRFPEVRWEEWRRTDETPGTGSDPSIRFGVYERVASEGASR